MTFEIKKIVKLLEKMAFNFSRLVFNGFVTQLFTNFLKYKRNKRLEKILDSGKVYWRCAPQKKLVH